MYVGYKKKKETNKKQLLFKIIMFHVLYKLVDFSWAKVFKSQFKHIFQVDFLAWIQSAH